MNMPEEQIPAGPEPIDVRLARIEERLGSIQKHGATKADVQFTQAKIEHMGRIVIMWTVATGLVVVALLLTLLPRLVS